MSDLSMYELEDIIWDDFNQDEDHIVPHLTNTGTPKNPFQRDTYKKFGKNLDKNKNMMEKESFNPSYDVEIVKDTCEDTRMPDKCFKKSYATSAPGDNDNSYSYPLTHISQSEDLYYGWPDIGTLEDVDNMLRSCDSSFGLENDEWFTNDQIGGGLNNNILPEGYLMDSCGDLSFEGGTVSENDDKKQGFKPLFVGSPKQKGMSLEIGSLNVPETSSISSELDEISLEATSFRHLQQIMEQLDLRTKLCIRDSLYRLARSAEQRHINPIISNEIGGPLMAERSDTGLMDMETDTNPIDRSVAHLLFHRPSESPKINAKQGSMKGEKACKEEANVK